MAVSYLRLKIADTISNGAPKRAFEDLLRRLTDRQPSKLARSMAAELAPCSTLPASKARTLIEQAIDKQSQQVWRITTYVVHGLKEKLLAADLSAIGAVLDGLIPTHSHRRDWQGYAGT